MTRQSVAMVVAKARAALAHDSGSSDGKTEVGLYMLGAGASFLVPYLATRGEAITPGMADAWWYGSTRGALHGFFVYGLSNPSSYPSSTVLTAMSLGSIA